MTEKRFSDYFVDKAVQLSNDYESRLARKDKIIEDLQKNSIITLRECAYCDKYETGNFFLNWAKIIIACNHCRSLSCINCMHQYNWDYTHIDYTHERVVLCNICYQSQQPDSQQ